MGTKIVLMKGGGVLGELRGVDVWFDGQNWEIPQTETIDTKNTHGAGCTLSAAIAANLATGQDRLTAVCKGKDDAPMLCNTLWKLGQEWVLSDISCLY